MRRAAGAPDGLLDPQTSVRPREIMTDTAGYTDVVFGLFRLLGYQFAPRLRDAGGARFWRLDPAADSTSSPATASTPR
jgi:TnpA family transposase